MEEKNQNEIMLTKQQEINIIVANAPQAFAENQKSHDACLTACKMFMEKVSVIGMNEEIDQEAAVLLERTRKTLKKMNDKRSPVTKLFDLLRGRYTAMENDINVSTRDTLPYQIQQLRNDFAKKKREEEERRRQAEILRQEQERARTQYRIDCETMFGNALSNMITKAVNKMVDAYNNCTLETYDKTVAAIQSVESELPDVMPDVAIHLPMGLQPDEAETIKAAVFKSEYEKKREQYAAEILSNRESYLEMLPSKKKQLEAAAKADAAEAERIKQQMALRDAEEQRRKEAERRAREEEERRQQELKASQQQMNDLFGAEAAQVQQYVPKMQVKRVIKILNPEGILPILNMWWAKEGCTMTVEELSKTFKKQITFCEKLANDKTNPQIVQHESIEYIEEVKAK